MNFDFVLKMFVVELFREHKLLRKLIGKGCFSKRLMKPMVSKLHKLSMVRQLCMGQQRMGELSKLRLEQQLEHMGSSMIVLSKPMEQRCKQQQQLELHCKRLERHCRQLGQRYKQLKQLELQQVVSKTMELSEQQHLMSMRRQLGQQRLVHIQLMRKQR